MNDDDNSFIVTMADLRAAKMCSRRGRYFCQIHGLDWLDFVDNGLPAQTLLDTGDALALQIVEVARERRR